MSLVAWSNVIDCVGAPERLEGEEDRKTARNYDVYVVLKSIDPRERRKNGAPLIISRDRTEPRI